MQVVINGWFWGQPATGSGQYLRHLLEALLRMAGEHTWVLVLPSEEGDHEVPADVHAVRTQEGDARPGRWGKVWFEQMAFPRLCQHMGADVAWVPYWASPLWPSCPTVVTVHDAIPLLFRAYRGGVLGEGYLRLVMASVRRAQRVLTDSQASKRDLERYLHLPAERIRVVPLAADPRCRPVVDGAERARVRERYALPARFALYLGGFDRRKNILGLLRAFALWTNQAGDGGGDMPHLVVAGRLPDRANELFPDPLRAVEELDLKGRVHFPGWVEDADKPALYSLADFFVFPSLYEGFGLPVLEAMACGRPVVVSGRASLPEIVGEAGLLVAPEDVSGWASAMASLWDNPDARRAWGKKALAQARRFRWEETAAATLSCLEEAVAI
ncbi:MAG: glycosyltransferase family 4 protein [Anaerolineae bacterium]